MSKHKNHHIRPDKIKMYSASNVMANMIAKKKQNHLPLDIQIGKLSAKRLQLLKEIEICNKRGIESSAKASLVIKIEYRLKAIASIYREQIEARENQAEKPILPMDNPSRPNTKLVHKTVGYNKGRTIAKDDIVLGDKPVLPKSLGRSYKIGRRILRDHIVQHGTVSRVANSTGAKPSKRPKAKRPISRLDMVQSIIWHSEHACAYARKARQAIERGELEYASRYQTLAAHAYAATIAKRLALI